MNSIIHLIRLAERCNVFAGHSTRLSNAAGAITGLIVVILNGEGRGAASRAIKPKGN